jgi:formylglycine-generating enzyme required for sulfatase activity
VNEPRHLRVFLASPGDVSDERSLVIKVLDELNYEPLLRGKIRMEVAAWDHPDARSPMLSGMSAQDSVIRSLGKPSECDIVVFILWSRLGSPIRVEAYKKTYGSGYYTGTEWEYEDALQAFKAQGRPLILRYLKTETPTVALTLDDREAMLERYDQLEQVNAFLAFCHERDGSIANEYAEVSEFEETFEKQLKALIRQILDSEMPVVKETASPQGQLPLCKGSPFPGLRTFTDKDAPIFFGRSRETADLIRKLRDPSNRFVTVVGASGSGKSSLVWAGLIPRLQAGAIEGSQDWAWLRFTPGELGDNPFLALAASLRQHLARQTLQPLQFAEELYTTTSAFGKLVRWVLEGKPDGAKLLLFIDQFEELLTRVALEYLNSFIALLSEASRMDQVRTIATIRADFYHRWLDRLELRGQFEREQLERGHFPVLAPGAGQLHEMITRPAKRAGLVFDDDLPERILNDTGTEAGALPLMAFALRQLYKAKTADGRLTRSAYEAFDGVHGAIGKRADDAFEALTSEVQGELGNVFLGLLEVDEQGVATRRRAPMSEVARSQTANTLVCELTDARLLVTDEAKNEAHEPMVEVAHEALFRSWPRLAEWIQTTADDHRLRRQITQLAQYWESHERRDEHRWSDDRVEEVVGMLAHLGIDAEDLPELERDFLGPLDRVHMRHELEEPDTRHERRAIIGVRLSLLGDPRPGVGLRKDGLPDIVWCKVSRGKVTLEENAGTFKVDPFNIAKYPVTWTQYQVFLDAEDGFHNPVWWQGLPFKRPDKPGRQFNRRKNHPAENVAWDESVAYCRWLTDRFAEEIQEQFGDGFVIRLPTEWEWQQAATGGDSANDYPWGAEWDSDRANTVESDLNRSTAVGMYPQGASPVGALDMAGNVWEWCLNTYDNPSQTTLSGDVRRVLRGGSWDGSRDLARAAFRNGYGPLNRSSAGWVCGCCVRPPFKRSTDH